METVKTEAGLQTQAVQSKQKSSPGPDAAVQPSAGHAVVPTPQTSNPSAHIRVTPTSNATQVVIQRAEVRPIKKSKARSLKVLGIFQLALGISMFLLNIPAIFVWAEFSYVGAGMWVGVLVMLSGAFGIVAARKPTRGPIITFMVMSIISAIMVWFLIGFSAGGLGHNAWHTHTLSSTWYTTWSRTYTSTVTAVRTLMSGYWSTTWASSALFREYIPATLTDTFIWTTMSARRETAAGTYWYAQLPLSASKIAMNGIMLLLGLAEVIVAIIASSITCSAICCRHQEESGTLQYVSSGYQTTIIQSGSRVQCTTSGQSTPCLVSSGARPAPNLVYVSPSASAAQPAHNVLYNVTSVTDTPPDVDSDLQAGVTEGKDPDDPPAYDTLEFNTKNSQE